MKDHYVNVQGYRTRYWDEGSGQPLLLVHGLGSSVENWLFSVAPLAKRFRVVAPDLLGFGLTDKPRDPNEMRLERASSFLGAFMDAVGIDAADVAGNSMGGIVSLQFVLDDPSRVKKLVLVNPAGFGREVHISYRLQSVPLLGEILATPSRRGTLLALETAAYQHDFIDDDLAERFHRLGQTPGNKEAYLTAVRRGVDVRGVKAEILDPLHRRIPGISAPTLLIWGRHDRILPISQLETARRLMPQARVYIFENCGHIPMFECPDEFIQVMLDFLA